MHFVFFTFRESLLAFKPIRNFDQFKIKSVYQIGHIFMREKDTSIIGK